MESQSIIYRGHKKERQLPTKKDSSILSALNLTKNGHNNHMFSHVPEEPQSPVDRHR